LFDQLLAQRLYFQDNLKFGFPTLKSTARAPTQRALGCFPRQNTPGKCPDKATYSHAYPAGHIVGLLDETLSRIYLAYLLVNVGYSNIFSMWDYHMNIWQKTWNFRSRKISCHRTLLTFSDCEHGWKTGSIHTIIPHGKSIGISYINQ
jgi:hypothetical protein